jgi:hypothetical protein
MESRIALLPGFGNTILYSEKRALLSIFYGGFGITKSMGGNTKIGAGLTFHCSNVKVMKFNEVQSFDILCITRLVKNLTLIDGCSVPRGGEGGIILSRGLG